ncbi:hypothetical protein CTI12_AA338460 [Artemisia annua]|uniref:Uncharacterized protein n=1 Tax=Artemisia annua TaxID=35608 RepID=A0A2U1MVI2_ARTAN|nr:hypothetical protein CTI12_AA338460 [Artemisia annua]
MQILETLIKEDDDQLKHAQLEIAKLQHDNDIFNRLAESESSVSSDLEEKIQELMLQIQIIRDKNKSMEILNCQKVDEVKRLTQTVLGLEPVLSGGEGKFHEIDVKVKTKQSQDKPATKHGGR